MFAFVGGLLLLAGGYFFYGRLTSSTVKPDPNRVTPAIARADGVDYVAMSTWRVYLVQLLNIAGLGPVFGPILGALWGPQVFLWVVFGWILGGDVHDLLVGAMSIRNEPGIRWPAELQVIRDETQRHRGHGETNVGYNRDGGRRVLGGRESLRGGQR